jgi:hypothetical protein
MHGIKVAVLIIYRKLHYNMKAGQEYLFPVCFVHVLYEVLSLGWIDNYAEVIDPNSVLPLDHQSFPIHRLIYQEKGSSLYHRAMSSYLTI